MGRERTKCDLPDELRCSRSDNKKWRCAAARADNCRYCERHSVVLRRNYEKRRNKKEGKKEGPPDVVIGITKHCMSKKYKIREPEIAETISLPGEILALDNLADILNVPTWMEVLTAAERSKLSAFLPDFGELDKTGIVKSLLNGEDLNFGNPATKWAESVCKGEQHPDVLLPKECELKLSQKQYFRDLKGYHNGFIASIEELKQVFESCNEDDAKFRKKLKKRSGKRLWSEIE